MLFLLNILWDAWSISAQDFVSTWLLLFGSENICDFVDNLYSKRQLSCLFATGRRDVYLVFKLLNVSKTGTLSEDEFASVYDVISLKWKVMDLCYFLNVFS